MERDIAWAAGLFEGEGCISDSGVNTVALHLGMSDRDIVDRFHGIVKVGSVTTTTAGRKRPLYYWSVANSTDVIAVLDMLQPYFGVRRTERATRARERLVKARKRGFCKRGHELTGDNLYRSPKGQTYCRTCAKDRESKRIKL